MVKTHSSGPTVPVMYNIHTNTSSAFKNKQKFFSAFPCLVTVSAYAKFKTDQKKKKKKDYLSARFDF